MLLDRWRTPPARAFARRWRYLQLDGIGVMRERIEWRTPGGGVLTASVLFHLPGDGRTVPGVSSASLWDRQIGGRLQPMLAEWEVHPTRHDSAVLIVMDWRLP